MYNPELTLDKALEYVGQVKNEEEHVFDRSHPLVHALKAVRECERRFKHDCGHPDVQEAYRNWLEQMTREGIKFYGIDAYDEGYNVDVNPTGAGFSSIAEILPNSIEHGANFCQRGPVKLRFTKAAEGLVAVTYDPGQGFDVKNVAKQRNTRQNKGNGIRYLVNSEKFMFGTERTAGIFRMILVYGIV